MFLFFFIIMVVLGLMLLDVLYMWVLLEVVFFGVVGILVYLGGKKLTMNGVVYYFFVQAMGGLILILSFLSEVCMYGNMYLLNNCIGVLNFFSCLMGLMIKLGFYPFYIQILIIMSLLNFKQNLVFLVYPKLLPLMMMYDIIQQGSALFIVFVFSCFLLVVSSVQGVITTDIRAILGWSGMSQLSWMVLSIFSNLFIFLVFFFFYSYVLIFFVESLNSMGEGFFFGFGSLGVGGSIEYMVFLMLIMMSGLAPFLFFYLKVLLVFSFPTGFYKAGLLLVLIVTIGVLFFYLRLMQYIIGVGYTSGFFKVMGGSLNFSGGFIMLFFGFLGGGVLLLLI
uniref:NADH-ubiquinone oxidoreductase chain 2 n=1 Tax=Polycarpa mytiligera TaxID=569436 RepID=S0DF54_POLMY|nr:NADH dehydrogenase subunit 2 [Polycarpa mytiligera]CCO25749.1 NADH dehydrogenase subunit 2 [Polycarpa mytiligera]